MSREKVKHLVKQRGSALVSVILTAAILTIIGTAVLLATQNNNNYSTTFRNYEKAYYVSEEMLHLGSDAMMKAGTMELQKYTNLNDVTLDEDFLNQIIETVKQLLPAGMVVEQANLPGLTVDLIDPEAGVIQLTAAGEVGGMTRYTSVYLTLTDYNGSGSGSGESYVYYPDYSTIIGGNVNFPQNHSARTWLTFTPQGVLGGVVNSNQARVYNTTSIFPSGFIWLDNIYDSLVDYFSDKQEGYKLVNDNIMWVYAAGSEYPLDTVNITKSAKKVKIGKTSFKSLANMILMVKGNVVFDSDLDYSSGLFENFMVLATGDISIDTTTKNNDIEDPIFLYSGATVYIDDMKGGGSHYISVYAQDFYYSSMDPGATKPTFYGQYMIKNDLSINIRNGSFDADFIYDSSALQTFYSSLNELAQEGLLFPGESTEEIVNLFQKSKITELTAP